MTDPTQQQPQFTPPPVGAGNGKSWFNKPGCLVPVVLVVLLFLVASCGAIIGGSGDDDDSTPTTTPKPASPETSDGSPTTVAFQRDEARFRAKFERREPEHMKQFSDADLIKWGDQACAEMSDKVAGATDDLEGRMKAEGVQADLAEHTASDFANSAAGSLCDPPGAL